MSAGLDRRDHFQPDSLSQAARSCGWLFSHYVTDWVSLSSNLLFMQVQYLSTTSSVAPPLLSLTHRLIHFPAIRHADCGLAEATTKVRLGRPMIGPGRIEQCEAIHTRRERLVYEFGVAVQEHLARQVS